MESTRVRKLYLGVDGGGTNCRVRLADENLVTLAEVTNGRSNLQLEGGDPAFRAISDGTRDVFAAANINFAETANTYACFGMAGGRMHTAREAFAARPWPFAGVKVHDDIDIAHAGALGGQDGAVIIVGTGSAGLAFVGGERFQVGGWGFQVGDQMSGAILGRELVRTLPRRSSPSWAAATRR
jgi:glucosamine kinase